jgi:hypothetical protein
LAAAVFPAVTATAASGAVSSCTRWVDDEVSTAGEAFDAAHCSENIAADFFSPGGRFPLLDSDVDAAIAGAEVLSDVVEWELGTERKSVIKIQTLRREKEEICDDPAHALREPAGR